MRFRIQRDASLPKLAWVADLSEFGAVVSCGSHVEASEGWIAEAVWDGDFEAGDFDRTSAVFGSGVRAREGTIRFVTSAGLVDRLWYLRSADQQWVGNSLPALLASSKDRLRSDVDYRPLIRNRPTPVGRIENVSSTREGVLSAVYWNHLVWDGDEVRVVPRPPSSDGFPDFEAYRDYLYGVVGRIGANGSDGARSFPVSLLSTISKGYDSPTVSVLAREAGCRRTITIRTARSVLPRDDSGEEIADHLGLRCQVVERGGRGLPGELAFWAADGRADDQNFATFPFDRGVTALFSGAYGGVIWGLNLRKHPAVADYADRNTLSFGEFRLLRGVLHCPVPYLGYDCAADVLRISRSSAMQRWSVGGDYDRPIPRRILVEAGVPSSMFAQHKSATQFQETFLWPRRPELQRSYAAYLRKLGQSIPSVRTGRFLNLLDTKFLAPIESRSAFSFRALRRWLRRPGTWLFNWANDTMADRLAAGRPPVAPRQERGEKTSGVVA